MSKLSKETKDDITYYVTKKGLDLRFSELCLSRDEVDIIDNCVRQVKLSRLAYLKAQHDAPHNVKANKKAVVEKWKEVSFTTIEEGHAIMAYLQEVYPTKSLTKEVKSETLNFCREMLKEDGFGVQRIRKIIPILVYILQDKEEEFEGLDEWREKINKNNPGLL